VHFRNLSPLSALEPYPDDNNRRTIRLSQERFEFD